MLPSHRLERVPNGVHERSRAIRLPPRAIHPNAAAIQRNVSGARVTHETRNRQVIQRQRIRAEIAQGVRQRARHTCVTRAGSSGRATRGATATHRGTRRRWHGEREVRRSGNATAARGPEGTVPRRGSRAAEQPAEAEERKSSTAAQYEPRMLRGRQHLLICAGAARTHAAGTRKGSAEPSRSGSARSRSRPRPNRTRAGGDRVGGEGGIRTPGACAQRFSRPPP
jgi:hypothetical protein